MMSSSRQTYDVIIIGAGIGGLVCGCYLAKAGLRVLIVEQHNKPGGYCTSFKRKGFTFDAAAHSIGGLKLGNVGNIFKDLGVTNRLKLLKIDPSDIVYYNKYRISYWSNIQRTISDFQEAFPHEADNIKRFFKTIINPEPHFFANVRTWTFERLLNNFFKNKELKAIIAYPLLGNGGLPPSLMSAFIGSKIYKEFLIDGGYYPEGCMQSLPDTLLDIFRENNGDIILSESVRKIIVENNRAVGVVLKKKPMSFRANYIISNIDAKHTFFNLIGREYLPSTFLKKINQMKQTLSMFILYLGYKKPIEDIPAGANLWILSDANLEEVYNLSFKKKILEKKSFMLHIGQDRKTVIAFVIAPFVSKYFWYRFKKTYMNNFIELIIDYFPSLTQNLIYKEAATPYTLYRYTYNSEGAAYGWASLTNQLADNDFRKPNFIKNLYLTGHWTTQGLGIPGVTYISYDLSRFIMRREKIL